MSHLQTLEVLHKKDYAPWRQCQRATLIRTCGKLKVFKSEEVDPSKFAIENMKRVKGSVGKRGLRFSAIA